MLSTGLTWPQAPANSAPLAAAEAPVRGDARRLRSLADRSAIAAEWQALAAHSPTSFFNTWPWIDSWLQTLPEATPLWLLRAVREGQVIGLGLVARGPHRRLMGLPFVPAWHLHASGLPGLDSICIEHNDFLLAADHAPSARRALVEQWLKLTHGARELHLPNLSELPSGQDWAQALNPQTQPQTQAQQTTLRAPLRITQQRKPSYLVDLAAVRAKGHDMLSLCSANLRSQVRRSLRAYAELGELRLDAAPDTATALAWLDRLAHLHQAHWTTRGQPGAFSQAAFQAFHRRLIQHAGTDERQPSHVQLLRLCAGTHELAYLYNFVHRGRVYFYQSGLDYDAGGKHARPGYAAHVLAIEFNARLGHTVYDFMMGDTRYKRDLATHQQDMHTVVLQPPALRFAVERLLRRLREQGRAHTPATATETPSTAPSAPLEA